MGLVNLKTNLKSLRYGNDQLGGGNSGQPYIQVPIPDGFNNLQSSNDDFILRGGALTARNSALDISRLKKMFTDPKTPNGQFFIAKQNLLSRTAVRTQTSGILNEGIYTPLSTLTEAGLVGLGGHVLKQGINPFAGTGAYSNNPNLYGVRVKSTQPAEVNRLVSLYNSINIGIPRLLNGFTLNNGVNVLTYSGGPGSILGVGKTGIRYADHRIIRNSNSNILFNQQFSQNTFTFTQKAIGKVGNSYLVNIGSAAVGQPQIQDFRKYIRNQVLSPGSTQEKNASESGATPNAPNYVLKNLEARVNIGGKNNSGPGNKVGKNLVSYTKGSGIGPVDKLNAFPIYQSSGVKQNADAPINDLVKFRIAVIDNSNPSQKTFIHFRAFIDSFSDSYNATWNPTTYLGRGENFYTYNNFTRNISMGWTVAAQSKEELIPMYKKLNYLASSLTPYYTSKGYMTGNLVQLTVGGYLYEQVGIINSLTYDIPEESPWEIGISDTGDYDSTVKELSHMIRVTNFSFTPIQDFIPSLQNNMYGPHGNVSEYGSQRYIALADGFGLQNNYTSDEFMDNLNPVMAPNTLPQSQPDRIQGVPISLP
jgi:hypothetical protein